MIFSKAPFGHRLEVETSKWNYDSNLHHIDCQTNLNNSHVTKLIIK